MAAQNQWLIHPPEADPSLRMRAHARTDNAAVMLRERGRQRLSRLHARVDPWAGRLSQPGTGG